MLSCETEVNCDFLLIGDYNKNLFLFFSGEFKLVVKFNNFEVSSYCCFYISEINYFFSFI